MSIRHITRNIQEKLVMARLTRQRRTYQQTFAIKKYGSWEAAEIEAQRWIDSTSPELPPPESAVDKMTARNTSGVVGIHLKTHTLRKKTGRTYEYLYWNGNWVGCPFSGGVSWSVNTYGDDDAFVLAVLSRRMKSIKRSLILAEYEAIKGTPEYAEILSQKQK